jgi:hypothetical protein
MTGRPYLKLPVIPDEGFPQSFRMSFASSSYSVSLYVNATDGALEASSGLLDLTGPGAFMVMTVAREGPDRPGVIFRRKLVVAHEYEFAELALLFTELKVDRRNLNGAGAFGSRITGGVASRWA